ncbi:hypothetical protein N0V88_000945 [Collariella sp. IMI 366227]|nr:hypothetical protein N0V88_000945 [Collariella sp. IMI 366227]
MTLSLVYRAARPSLLPSSTPVSLATISTRHASLSAIHKGLLRSEKSRPQGARHDRISDLQEGQKRMTYRERQKARQELAKLKPLYKIRRGKKDITEDPTEAKPQSRKSRFYDEENSFAKKSLVYQLKTGKLDEELKELQAKRGAESDSPFERTGDRPDLRPGRRVFGAKRSDNADNDLDIVAELSGPQRDSFSRDKPERDNSIGFSRDRPQRDSFNGDRPKRDAYDRDELLGFRTADRRPPRDPISITYTTAASQFLYGKAVVEAALRSPRRQLYKLYIYGGANRQNASDDALIKTLAKRKNVPVTIVGEDGLRMLDKMSQTRPHNGFILDPGNLGAILRTVSFLGATAVAITRRGSASLTPVALKASAGASETLNLFSISSLPEFLNASRENGWAVYAAVAEGPAGFKQQRAVYLVGWQ